MQFASTFLSCFQHTETWFFSLDEGALISDIHFFIMSQASSIPSRREFLTICGGVWVISCFFFGGLYALGAPSPHHLVPSGKIDQAAERGGGTIFPQQKEKKVAPTRV